MGTETTTQLITVVATLGGVVLTLIFSGYSERRRAHVEQATWLRNERVRAYMRLSTAGEAVLQFIRDELVSLTEARHAERRPYTEEQWRTLRTDLRNAYNQVALLGTDAARAAALDLWRAARDAGNEYWNHLHDDPPVPDLPGWVAAAASGLGTVGERFMAVCRQDLRVDQLEH